MKRNLFLGAALLIVVAFALGVSWYNKQQADHLDFLAGERAELFVRPHSPRLGSEEARVYIVKFSDPACETCAAFEPFVKQALDAFPGQVQLVLRYLPLHDGAHDVVRIIEASKRQGLLWETLHALYRNQSGWTHHHKVQIDEVWQFLPEGLDLAQLRIDMDDPAVVAAVRQDQADAAVLGVRKTPGFFVNGKPLEPFGARPLAELIKAEVREQYPE